MKSGFLKWLLEDISFKVGYDQDYTFKHNSKNLLFNDILTLHKDDFDDYKVNGRTHGLMSHAIKHLKEFDPRYFEMKCEEMRKKLILLYTKMGYKDVFSYVEEKEVNTSLKAIEKISSASILQLSNLMDLVNDKIEIYGVGALDDKDFVVKKTIDAISKKFAKLIEDKLKKATRLETLNPVTINKMNDKELLQYILSFPVISWKYTDPKSGYKKIVTLDLTDGGIIIQFEKGDIATFFALDYFLNKRTKISALKGALRKKIMIDKKNKRIYDLFSLLVNTR